MLNHVEKQQILF